MAVPKRKTSKRTKGQRNSHAALSPRTLVGCHRCGYQRPPHVICPQCGYYGKLEMVPKEE